jgi:hypothetical protein
MRMVAAVSVAAFVGATVASSTSSAPRDPWKALHRPLHIPHLGPGATCPTSPTQPATALNPGLGGYVLGRGVPVYAGAFPADAVVHYANGAVERGWHAFKVLWIVRPRYRGLVLIRGRQLDGSNPIGFRSRAELRISGWGTASLAGWGARASSEWLRAPGCYGFQIDGRRFSEVLVFRAEP